MNVTQYVSRMRSYLDDARVLKFTDLELVLMADEQLKYLTRKQNQTAKDWHNFSLALKKADARQVFSRAYEWRLPTWVKRVTRVFHRQQNATTETTLSPYRWVGGDQALLGEMIEPGDSVHRCGWTWEGQGTIRLWNMTEALDLVLQVVKMPSPLFKGVLTRAFPDASGFYLPNPLAYGELSLEEGAYINSEIQVSATQVATSTALGEGRRVIYSNANTIATTRENAVYVQANWPNVLAVGDTVESLLPIPDDSSYLLALLVLRGLSIKKGNIDLQKSVGGAIAQELTDFLESAGLPKDSAGPHWKTSRVGQSGRYDQDRLNVNRFQMW